MNGGTYLQNGIWNTMLGTGTTWVEENDFSHRVKGTMKNQSEIDFWIENGMRTFSRNKFTLSNDS